MTSLPMLTDLKDLCTELRNVDRRLGETHDALPDDSELARQVRGGIATVRSDLLADAVASLEALLSLDEPAAEQRRPANDELLTRLEGPRFRIQPDGSVLCEEVRS